MTSSILSAPIRAGGASPLRVATGGNASSGSKARCRRSPARTNRRRDGRCGWPQEPSPLRGFEGFATGRAALTYIGHLFMTKPRASLRSETCPISIGIGVRYGLEQVSELIGMRIWRWDGRYGCGTAGGTAPMCKIPNVYNLGPCLVRLVDKITSNHQQVDVKARKILQRINNWQRTG